MALGTLLASSAPAQVVEGYIQLPDSFGPILPPYHVAVDYSPGEERFFVGSESGDVVVVDAITCRKLARIATGPVTSLCYCSTDNKLYAAAPFDSVVVVDCNSYQVVKRLVLGGNIAWVFYNPLVDRVYCGTWRMKVIDCVSDSVVGSVPVAGPGASFAFDSLHNKLYVGAGSPLKVVDCDSDSVVATIQNVQGTTAMCYDPTDDRVYAAANTGGTWPAETLYAIDTKGDSVVHGLEVPNPAYPDFYSTFVLSCDPARGRVFAACSAFVTAVDCMTDAVMWQRYMYQCSGLASAPDLNKVYVNYGGVSSLDGSTGERTAHVSTDANSSTPVYLELLSRLYVTTAGGQLATVDCGVDTFQFQVLLTADANYACLDTMDDKLYFTRDAYRGYLGVADCQTRLVQSHWMCESPRYVVHDALDDRLYVATWNGWGGSSSGLSVFDCKSDSLVKVIPTAGYINGGLCWHPALDKVYLGITDSTGQGCFVVVIDCATDSVVRVIPRGSEESGFSCTMLTRDSNQFWGFSDNGYTVVDCLRDTVVMDTFFDDWHPHPNGVCCSPPERKVYVSHGCPAELDVLSMESLRPIRSVTLPAIGYETSIPIYVPAAGKVYGAAMADSGDSVYAVDTKTDSVVARFLDRHGIVAMCEDRTGRYVYCSTVTEKLLVIDTQSDSIVSTLSVPSMNAHGIVWMVPNRRTGRVYAEPGSDSRLAVIRDSVVIGVEESRQAATHPAILQTVVNRAVPIRSAAGADLFDASGRRAAVLEPGLNDIRKLAPGVYFVREQPQAASLKPQAVRKIVIAK